MACEGKSICWIIMSVGLLFTLLIYTGVKSYNTKKEFHYKENNNNLRWTILLTINDGFIDFFQNWIHYYRKLHLDNKVIVIAEDDLVFSRLQRIDKHLMITVVKSSRISSSDAVNYGSEAFSKLASGRPTYILKYLNKGLNIIYADVDAVWLQNPLPYFDGSFDIWMQSDGPGNLCTGLIAVKSNSESKQLMKSWEASLKQHLQIDQTAFNAVVRYSHVRLKVLYRNLFPSGDLYFGKFKDEQRRNVIVVHNNFIIGHPAKLQRFKQHSLWFSR